MKKLGRALLVLAAGLLSGLALVASATGTTATDSSKVRHLQLPVAALAIDGDRVTYALSSKFASKPNTTEVLVWNVRTGKTVKVSGNQTRHADNTSTGAGVFQLAIAGPRVAWLANVGGNTEGTDYLFTSSVTNPKERKVASASRFGDNCPGRHASGCAGPWLGGLVGSGNLLAFNRSTTDAQGNVASGGLYVLKGTQKRSIATGPATVSAVSADAGRVAVLRSDGSVALYSASGSVLRTVNPPSAATVALSGKNLVVLTKTRKLKLYGANTGSLRKTLSVRGTKPQNLDAQGNIAIYTTSRSVRAVNLSTGKDRAVGRLRRGVALARIDGAGLAYAGSATGGNAGKGTLVFVPLARVRAAVG